MEKKKKKVNGDLGKRATKKRADNIASYYKKNEKKLLSDRDGRRDYSFVYEITPLQDIDNLKLKSTLLVMNNVYFDTANYLCF